jgi:hypothetical protein
VGISVETPTKWIGADVYRPLLGNHAGLIGGTALAKKHVVDGPHVSYKELRIT